MDLQFNTNVTGRGWKLIRCEYCHNEFAYEIVRSATGFSNSPYMLDNQEAQQESAHIAQERVQAELEQGIDAVPCPHCGNYQRHMFSLARSAHRAWIGLLGLALLVGSLFAAVFWLIGMRYALHAAISTGCAAILLIVVKKSISSQYDPNNADQCEERKTFAKTKTISGAELQKMLDDAGG